MKSHLFARSLPLLAALGLAAGPGRLLAQTTNLINDGTTIANLTLLANAAGTAGATLSLTPDSGSLTAAQSSEITDLPLNGVWFNDRVFPATNRFAVLADARPDSAFPETLVGLAGWLDTTTRKGVVFRVRPGEVQGAFELAVVDFQAGTSDANVSTTDLWNLDGSPAQFLYGSAWGATAGYDPALFATLRLDVEPATAADRALVPTATARLTGRVYQGTDTPLGTEVQLLTSLPTPAAHRFGYHACWDTVFGPGSTIGYLKNLRLVGAVGTVNALPVVALTQPAAGERFAAPATVVLTATATDSDGTVKGVEFLQGSTVVGSSATPPYTTTVPALPVGSYTFTARAVDDLNGVGISAPVTVEVVKQVLPALLTSAGVPAAGQFEFTATNLTGTSYRLESSGDLQGWTPVETAPVTAATKKFTVPQSGGHLYFRLVTLP
jgi:hypothetical protein